MLSGSVSDDFARTLNVYVPVPKEIKGIPVCLNKSLLQSFFLVSFHAVDVPSGAVEAVSVYLYAVFHQLRAIG